MKKLYKLTADGVAELQGELNALIADRPEITDRIKTAREMGDLSENAEYASAKNEQANAEARIAELEHILKNVDLIKAPKRVAKFKLDQKLVCMAVEVTKNSRLLELLKLTHLPEKLAMNPQLVKLY